MKANLRSGATDKLKEALVNILMKKSLVIVTKRSVDDLGPLEGLVDICLAGLTVFQDTAGCLDQLGRLKKWADKHATVRTQKKLAGYLATLATASEADQFPDAPGQQVEFETLQNMMARYTDETSTPDIPEALQRSMPLILKTLRLRVAR